MLKSIDKKNFNKYLDFAYSLALYQKTSSYPTYTDGIKTKKDFILHAKRGINDKNHQILLFEYEKEIVGWIHYYALQNDKLIAFETFNIEHHCEIAFDEFKKLHDNCDNMYWNSKRLYDEIINQNEKSQWFIYLYYQNQKLAGNIYFICLNDLMEIFGIDYIDKKFNPITFKNLTIKALNKAKEINISHLYFFTDKNEHSILRDLGFTHIGNYELYEKIL